LHSFKALWDDVIEVSKIRVSDFFCIASKWLCNTRYLQFNVVSSAVLWSIWNNRNSIVFNMKTWLNMKQVASGSGIPEKLEGAIQGQGVVDGGSILKAADQKAQAAARTEAGLELKLKLKLSMIGSVLGVLRLLELITVDMLLWPTYRATLMMKQCMW
jgi:hypothetical protein